MTGAQTMPAWDDKQIRRFTYRVGLFVRRGLPTSQAEELADRLAERDWERDDRRVCVECNGFRAESTLCRNRQPVMPAELLHRCHRFEWMKPQ